MSNSVSGKGMTRAEAEKIISKIQGGKGSVGKPDLGAALNDLKACVKSSIAMNLSGRSMAIASLTGGISGSVFDAGDAGYGIVEVTVSADRPSLNPANGTVDIANILNDGMRVSAGKRTPKGLWHGKEIQGRYVFAPTHFMEAAAHTFVSRYGAKHNVTNYIIT